MKHVVCYQSEWIFSLNLIYNQNFCILNTVCKYVKCVQKNNYNNNK